MATTYTEFVTKRAADIFSNADWREGQNIASGLTLSVKEMFNRALEQAENEYDAKLEEESGILSPML